MSFPRYPKYKASGVEWLGEIPEGWELKPLRNVFKFSKGLTITKEDLRDEGVQCVNYGEIHSKYGFRLNPDMHPLRCVAPEYLLTNPDALIQDGDFVFADTSEDLEGSGNFTHLRSDFPIFAGYHTIIGRPRKDIKPLLLAYQIHSNAFRSQIQRQMKGVKVFSISQGILKAAKCLLPPLAEQTAIAEFLDRETGKIDELVAEQRRLMELLKEKRQAVISHAVTKGLNPNAPMKPSGIEWLGDVPEHWTVSALKWLTQSDRPIMYGIVLPGPDVGEGVPILKGGNVKPSRMNLESMARTTPEIEEKFARARLREGDLVYAIRGTIGDCEQVPQEMEGSNITQDVARVAIDETNCAAWARWALLAPAIQEELACGSLGAAVRGINIFDLKRVKIPTPPPAEQREISAFLDRETSKLEELTAESQRAIDLLQERRTALISAAVTGQIDVRKPPKS